MAPWPRHEAFAGSRTRVEVQVSIVSENRHEISHESEAALHQVVVELSPDALPADYARLDELEQRLVVAAELWARDCIAERHVGLTEP